MNTYEFTLVQNRMSQSKLIRAVDFDSAKDQLDDELEAGWVIATVLENGKYIYSLDS